MIQIDMEMPKNCKFCPLHDVNPDQCPIRTIYKDDYATSRFTDCPLYKIAEDTDTISRQAVIDALMEILDRPNHAEFLYTDEICKALKALPSTQPDVLACGEGELIAQPEIIRCNDCKHWTQTTGNMCGFGLGDCDYINAKLVNCNGFCSWAERRTDE